MNKITVLLPQEAAKIAAGEVVERPASAVKELIENALDASATHITLHIGKAGKELIRVVDNGCGMSRDDAKLCFTDHATSKITTLADLNTIGSFGFRGEALATISSVSNVTLKTKQSDLPNDALGVELQLADGKFTSEKDVSCSPGTDIAIRDLFYNTPVRKKFLKQDETEWNQIQNLFYAFCLSNLPTHFTLYRDERMILNVPPVSDVRDRITQIWGHNFGQNMSPLNAHESITGYISNHNFWRYGRQQLFFFVNGRWVKNAELSKAVLKGYRNVLPPAKFPAVFLFITLPTDQVDINVHPRKEEVRFAKPVGIQNALQELVSRALETGVSAQLEDCKTRSNRTGETRSNPFETVSKNSTPSGRTLEEKIPFVLPCPAKLYAKHGSEQSESNVSERHERCGSVVQRLVQAPLQKAIPPGGGSKKIAQDQTASNFLNEPQSPILGTKNEHSIRIIGQFLKTYIVIENHEGLLIIDQHAAHERILYEKFLKNFEHKDGTRLLFPEVVTVTPAQLQLVLREQDFFADQGIELEQFGDNQIAIKTSPPKIQSNSLKEIVLEAIAFIEENEQLDREEFRKKLNEHTHSHMACKMAVKAGNELTQEMMHNIVNDLMSVDNRFICVHGRPTTWTIRQEELEKKFRRR